MVCCLPRELRTLEKGPIEKDTCLKLLPTTLPTPGLSLPSEESSSVHRVPKSPRSAAPCSEQAPQRVRRQ